MNLKSSLLGTSVPLKKHISFMEGDSFSLQSNIFLAYPDPELFLAPPH